MRQIFYSHKILLCLAFSFLVSHISAQEKIQTDRPDQSDGASVISNGKFQLESSIIYARIKDSAGSYISSTLLRYGLFKGFELRATAEQGKNRDLYISETVQGFYPLTIGFKSELLQEKKYTPAISLVGYLQLPFTNHNSKGYYWSPALFLIAEKKIDHLMIDVNVGPKQAAFSNEWSVQFSGDLKYEAGEHLNVFGEYFAQCDSHQPQHNVDFGVQLLVTKSVELHVAAGSSIHYRPHNYFLSIGGGVAF
ncbi:transporter [Pollutibacter soli]|uniref:transporter n=1 Tax=Pollutibacter soli TaxID=3034157 RepID=UPI003013DB09